MAMKSETIIGYFLVAIIGLALMAWIFNDIVSSKRELRVEIEYLERNVENLGKSLQSLVTDRYIVYINTITNDTLYIPAFEEMPEYDAGVNIIDLDTVGRVDTPKEKAKE